MELIEQLKHKLSSELWKEFQLEQGILKSRLKKEVKKMIDNSFIDMTVRMERKVESIVIQALNKLDPSNNLTIESGTDDCEGGEQLDKHVNAKNHANGEVNNDATNVAAKDGQVEASGANGHGNANSNEAPETSIIADYKGENDSQTSHRNNVNTQRKFFILDSDDESDEFAESDFEDDESSIDEMYENDYNHVINTYSRYENSAPSSFKDSQYHSPQQLNPSTSLQEIKTRNVAFTRKRKLPKMTLDPKVETTSESYYIRFGVRCTIEGCKVISDSKREFFQHLLTTHGKNPFVCVLRGCGRSFSDNAQLLVHSSSVHKNVTKWVCESCLKEHDSDTRLHQHYFSAHFQHAFRCAVERCQFTSSRRMDALRHLHVHHPKEFKEMKATRKLKHYLCPYTGCDKVFTERTNLLTHKRFHARSKPFGCSWPQCDYLSEDRANTIRHIRVRHLRLPATVKEQTEKGITCDQDARQWLQVFNEKF